MNVVRDDGTVDQEGLTAALIPVMLEVARLQMRVRSEGLDVMRKSDCSPVTKADQHSEALLLAALRAIAPGIPVIAEEEVSARRIPELTAGQRFFLVDPLDGTREYIDNRDEFTINVALVDAGQPIYGFIVAPALKQLFATCSDGSAWTDIDALDATVAPLSGWRPLHTRQPDNDGLEALCSRLHVKTSPSAHFTSLNVRSRRAVGSSLKFCVVARGEADIYVRMGPTSEWDTAAGQAILEAAGGCVTDMAGQPLKYGKAGGRFLNPHFIAWGRQPSGDWPIP